MTENKTPPHPPVRPFRALADCPALAAHTPQPSGYTEWVEDCERRETRGETQGVCPVCGLWAIWRKPYDHLDAAGATVQAARLRWRREA